VTQADPAEIRPAQFADDQWYPSSASRLRQTLRDYVDAVPERPLGRPLGLVSPHAGLRFSGSVAAHAYRQVQGRRYEIVAAISPLHRLAVHGFAITRYRHYSTPLGRIPLDEELVAQLTASLSVARVGQDNEHSLEIQLPFLQHALGDFNLLPVMMGDQSFPACEALAGVLAEGLANRSALIVASSDLSHFHPYDTAVQLDRLVADRIQAFDPAGLADALEEGTTEACGGGPIITAMLACRALGADNATVLAYANSGDVWVDRSSVVGFMAAAFWRQDRV
jgi:AmmeMemoRadiSam system protein B